MLLAGISTAFFFVFICNIKDYIGKNYISANSFSALDFNRYLKDNINLVKAKTREFFLEVKKETNRLFELEKKDELLSRSEYNFLEKFFTIKVRDITKNNFNFSSLLYFLRHDKELIMALLNKSEGSLFKQIRGYMEEILLYLYILDLLQITLPNSSDIGNMKSGMNIVMPLGNQKGQKILFFLTKMQHILLLSILSVLNISQDQSFNKN